ncbi:hypothetical protein ACLKA6_013328 [Drosophila palustris]
MLMLCAYHGNSGSQATFGGTCGHVTDVLHVQRATSVCPRLICCVTDADADVGVAAAHSHIFGVVPPINWDCGGARTRFFPWCVQCSVLDD